MADIDGLVAKISVGFDETPLKKYDKAMDSAKANTDNLGRSVEGVEKKLGNLQEKFKKVSKQVRDRSGENIGRDVSGAVFGEKGRGIFSALSRTSSLLKSGNIASAFGTLSLGAIKATKYLYNFADAQAKVINRADIQSKMLSLNTKEVLGLAQAYDVLGLNSSSYFAARKESIGISAGLGLGQLDQGKFTALARIGANINAFLNGDTDAQVKTIGDRYDTLKSSGDKKGTALIETMFSNLLETALADRASLANLGMTMKESAKSLSDALYGSEKNMKELTRNMAQLTYGVELLAAKMGGYIGKIFNSAVRGYTNAFEYVLGDGSADPDAKASSVVSIAGAKGGSPVETPFQKRKRMEGVASSTLSVTNHITVNGNADPNEIADVVGNSVKEINDTYQSSPSRGN